jgi:hypothetical protein
MPSNLISRSMSSIRRPIDVEGRPSCPATTTQTHRQWDRWAVHSPQAYATLSQACTSWLWRQFCALIRADCDGEDRRATITHPARDQIISEYTAYVLQRLT